MLQLAISVASGQPFMGLAVRQGRVLFLSLEDDSNELRRRVYAISEASDLFGFSEEIQVALCESLFLVDWVGRNVKLTSQGARVATINQEIVSELAAFVREQSISLVICDTYSRLNGGDENDNGAAALFVSALEGIRAGGNVTILVTAHVTKAASKGPARAGDVAGGARFSDSARWCAVMDRYLLTEGKDLDPETAKHVRLTVVKSNYTGVGTALFMEHHAGMLYHRQGPAQKPTRSRPSANDTAAREKLLTAICDAAESGKPLRGLNAFRHFTRRKNGLSDKSARVVLEGLIKDGLVTREPTTLVLRIPKE